MENKTIIHLENISVFRDKILVLSGVDLKINRGEFVYLLGKTGCGKTSLLKTLYAEIPIEKGKAEIAGYDLAKINIKEIPFLRRKLGIVFQDFQLLTDRTVNANLEFIMKSTDWKKQDDIEKRANEVLAKVGIPTKGFKMPHELSGGEQQRVCIARALINSPGIILADEPTGNLDPDTSRNIIRLLHEIGNTGTTVILATHNHNLAEDFPGRIIKMDKGKIVEDRRSAHSEEHSAVCTEHLEQSTEQLEQNTDQLEQNTDQLEQNTKQLAQSAGKKKWSLEDYI